MRLGRSRWAVGSSSIIRGVSCASARASITFWLSPSLSVDSFRVEKWPIPAASMARSMIALSAVPFRSTQANLNKDIFPARPENKRSGCCRAPDRSIPGLFFGRDAGRRSALPLAGVPSISNTVRSSGRLQTGQGAQQGRFARSVRAQQTDQLPGMDLDSQGGFFQGDLFPAARAVSCRRYCGLVRNNGCVPFCSVAPLILFAAKNYPDHDRGADQRRDDIDRKYGLAAR